MPSTLVDLRPGEGEFSTISRRTSSLSQANPLVRPSTPAQRPDSPLASLSSIAQPNGGGAEKNTMKLGGWDSKPDRMRKEEAQAKQSRPEYASKTAPIEGTRAGKRKSRAVGSSSDLGSEGDIGDEEGEGGIGPKAKKGRSGK